MSDKQSQEKADRLKAALRENLRRRKAQARRRGAAGGEREATSGAKGAEPSKEGGD